MNPILDNISTHTHTHTHTLVTTASTPDKRRLSSLNGYIVPAASTRCMLASTPIRYSTVSHFQNRLFDELYLCSITYRPTLPTLYTLPSSGTSLEVYLHVLSLCWIEVCQEIGSWASQISHIVLTSNAKPTMRGIICPVLSTSLILVMPFQ